MNAQKSIRLQIAADLVGDLADAVEAMGNQLDRLHADLLAALEQIASYEIGDNLNYYNARRMIEIAREALEKS